MQRRQHPLRQLTATVFFVGWFHVAAATASIKLKIGWIGGEHDTIDTTDSVASFLTAVRCINMDPATHLGNASMYLEPYIMPVIPSTGDEYSVGVMRAFDKMSSENQSYLAFNGTHETRGGGHDVDIAIISGSTDNLMHLAPLSEFSGKPLLSYTADGDILSDKENFPSVSRVVPPDRFQALAFATTAQSLGWTRVGIFHPADVAGNTYAAHFSTACSGLGITVVATATYPPALDHTSDTSLAAISDTAEIMKAKFERENVKVYVAVGFLSDAFTALKVINESTMFGPGYTIFTSVGVLSAAYRVPQWNSLMQGSIGAFPYYNRSSPQALEMWNMWPLTAGNWSDLLNTAPNSDDFPNLPQPSDNALRFINPTFYSWDATFLAAKALANAYEPCANIDENGRSQDLGCLLTTLRSTVYQGTSRTVRLNAQGDRLGDYAISNYVSGMPVPVGLGVTVSEAVAAIVMDPRALTWSDGSSGLTTGPDWGQAPHVTPAPTIPNAVEASSQESPVAVATSATLGLLLLVVAAAVVWRRHVSVMKKFEPTDFLAIIQRVQEKCPGLHFTYEHVEGDDTNGELSDATGLKRMLTRRAGRSGVNVPAELSRKDVVLLEELGSGQFGQVYRGYWSTCLVKAKGKTSVPVAVKTVSDEYESAAAQVAFLEEAAVTWQFDHENVVQMYGVVTSGYPYLLVLELCALGELLEYVSDPDHTHTATHLVGLLRNVASGMAYLSSRKFIHRDLAARNVLLTAEKTAKIADFGLGRSLTNEEDYYKMTKDIMVPIRWTDPWALEQLRFNEFTDVWSYGVVMIEVFNRGERLYGEMSNLEVLEMVKEGQRLKQPETMPDSMYFIARQCWVNAEVDKETAGTDYKDQYFAPRITFSAILEKIEDIHETMVCPTATQGFKRSTTARQKKRIAMNNYLLPTSVPDDGRDPLTSIVNTSYAPMKAQAEFGIPSPPRKNVGMNDYLLQSASDNNANNTYLPLEAQNENQDLADRMMTLGHSAQRKRRETPNYVPVPTFNK